MPSTEPTSPWITPSTRISPTTVRRVAPNARSMPRSRRRSATRVRKVLKMMNPPMASPSIPTTPTICWMVPTHWVTTPPDSSGASRYPSPSAACTAFSTCARSAPAATTTSTVLIRSGWFTSRCAAASGT